MSDCIFLPLVLGVGYEFCDSCKEMATTILYLDDRAEMYCDRHWSEKCQREAKLESPRIEKQELR